MSSDASGSFPSNTLLKDPDVRHVEKPDEEVLIKFSPEQHAKTFRKVD